MGKRLDGRDLAARFSAGAQSLERELSTLNRLNVFPVPDADTGTNMVNTVRRAILHLEGLAVSERQSAGHVARVFADGAFAGARGNSGVILAEILRGFARGLDGADVIGGRNVVDAFREGSRQGYSAVSKPVEGTMLTVVKDVAEELDGLPEPDASDAGDLIRRAAEAARRSVDRTPDLLPLLKASGVVDSGALGIAVFLDGMTGSDASGNDDWIERLREPAFDLPVRGDGAEERGEREEGFGFCTEFIISGLRKSPEDVRGRFETLGDSLVIAGDRKRLRVHVHTAEPGAALSAAITLGMVTDISIRNMDEQALGEAVAGAYGTTDESGTPSGEPVIVVLPDGAGFADVFESLGFRTLGGRGPVDAEDVLAAISAVQGPAGKRDAIVLSCDPALGGEVKELVRASGDRHVHMVNASTAPAGVSALMAYTYGAPVEQNLSSMNAAAGRTVVVGADDEENLRTSLESVSRRSDMGTLYYADGDDESGAGQIAVLLAAEFGLNEVEIVFGGQNGPKYLLAME